MIAETKVPSPGESITEVEIANWLVKDGDYVSKDDELCEIDSDKATLTVNAEESGVVKILIAAGEKVAVGATICTIDTSAKTPAATEKKKEKVAEVVIAAPEKKQEVKEEKTKSYADGVPSVSAKKLMDENSIPASKIIATGKEGRITKGDVLQAISAGFSTESISNSWQGSRETDRQKMSSLRRKLAERLVGVKNQTAMLTTFNEVDMSGIMELRKKYKDKFKEKHGVGVGFMSFFTKAVTEALFHFPAVNAMLEGEEIVYHKYCDIGIAVSAPKGLMVPVIRNAETLSLADIEKSIAALAGKARDGKLSIEEMTGGTFTITNGGVFGSMLSTPILNPPQSAILGMHNIVERPVAVNVKVEIRPIMYVALSYDHRIIDGRESVGFLVKVKEMLENPQKILFGSKAPEEILLGL